nr:hypothetical protein [Tanacetum cinerariifolium]
MFWHTAKDDTMFNMIKVISRHQDTHIYATILPDVLTNQEMLDSKAYKKYYAIASGEVPPKAKTKYKKKNDEPVTSPKIMDTTKAQQIALDDALVAHANRLKIRKCNHRLSFDLKSNEPTIQLVLDALKLTPFYNAFQITANVPEIYMQEFWATVSLHHNSLHFKMNENSHTLNDENFIDMLQICPRLPSQRVEDPPFEEEILSFIRDLGYTGEIKGDSEDEDDTDDDGDNDDDAESDDHDDDSDDEITKYDSDEILDPNLTNVDQTKYEEEEEEEDIDEVVRNTSDDEFTDEEKLDDEETMDKEVLTELYKDVNVNFGNDDAEMTDANQGGLEQQNKANEPVQSSSISSDFTSKFLNLENPSFADNEIASLMETLALHATVISEITSDFTTTTPPPPPCFNPVLQQQTPTITTPTFTTITPINPTVTLSEIPNFASVFKFHQRMKEAVNVVVQLQTNKLKEEAQAENQEFLNQVDSTMKTITKDQVKSQVSKMMPKIKKYVTKTLGAEVLVRSTTQPQTAYVDAAPLSKSELNKILIDKIEANKSINRSETQKNLYNALVESYNSDKDIITTYGDVVLLKKGRDDQDKDEDPSVGSDRGTKRRKSDIDAESSKDSSHTIEESGMQQDQEFVMGDNDAQPIDKEKYDYGHLEEIEVRRDDQQLYTFKEGDFKRLRQQDIEDMLLFLVERKLTNLTDERLKKTKKRTKSDQNWTKTGS